MVQGSLLIKPDMSHMVTYPDWYADGETYISYKWDFSNFNDSLRMVTDSSRQEERLKIASNAQNLYRFHLSERGREDFVSHIRRQLLRS